MNDTTDGLVNVAVPREHLMAVYALLASLDGPGIPQVVKSTRASEPRREATELGSVWSVDDLRRFATTPTKTSGILVKVLNLLAKTPDTYVSTSDLERLTGVPRANLKGAFSALTRHLNKHYAGQKWMLAFQWGPAIGPDFPAEGHYKLTPEQAERWTEAARDES